MSEFDASTAPASAPARGIGSLGWPSPLLDPSVELDPYVSATAAEGAVQLKLRSGRSLRALCTVPAPGVLRVRTGADPSGTRTSPSLIDFDEQPARVAMVDGGVSVTGPEVESFWSADGQHLEIGAFSRAPGLTLIGGPIGGTGRLMSGDTPAGWLETVWLAPDAAVYGGGESFQGPNLRGRIRRLINHETHGASGLDLSYLNVPLFWSDAGWGVFIHSSAPVRADLGAAHSEVAAFGIEDDEMDVFFILGDPATIIRRYHELTGLPGRVPDWGLGVWTSRCSYLSASEIDVVVDGYQEAGCPVDVVHVDAWLEGNLLADLACNWTIDRARYPEGWARELADRGVKVSLWHNPYVTEGSDRAIELEEAGFLAKLPDGSLARTPDKTDRFLIDFTNPDAAQWWKDQIRRVAREEGNASFKPDFAEEVPLDAVFADGRTGREIRNEYSLLYQAATNEALREELGTDEIVLFCRSGAAGAQRYPCHWVGDTPSTWTGLVTAVRACLSLSLSGFGAVAHDVGGFWTPKSFQVLQGAFANNDPSGFEPDVEPELFLRWTQWGALSAMMRFHGTGRREPWAYPDPHGKLSVDACRLRERLHDYLVATAKEAATDGTPMMRPMVFAYPQDRSARDAELQYLLGTDILVAPITGPGGTRALYVPEGEWRPLWGLDPISGPGWRSVRCELDQFPAWVRAGSSLRT